MASPDHEVGHAKIYQCTKFEILAISVSNYPKGVPKFTNLAPTTFLGGDILSSALPYSLAGLRRKSARGWKEGREDETWE